MKQGIKEDKTPAATVVGGASTDDLNLSAIEPLDFTFLKLPAYKSAAEKKLSIYTVSGAKTAKPDLDRIANQYDFATQDFAQGVLALVLHKYTGATIFILNSAVYNFAQLGDMLDVITASKASANSGCIVIQDEYSFLLRQQMDGDEISVIFEYDRGVIDPTLLRYFAENYQQLFSEISHELLTAKHNHFKPINEYLILNKQEYEKLVYASNAIQGSPSTATAHAVFEQQAAKTPDNIAVVYGDRKLTYRQLNEKANQLAHYIRSRVDIKPDTLIALCLDRSEQMIVAILATLKSGAAYVPIEPSYPIDRIQFVVDDTQTQLIITNAAYEQMVNSLSPDTDALLIDDVATAAAINAQPTRNVTSDTSHLNLAYVIYTSGTTGRPKGVMVEHSGLVSFCLNNNYCPINEDNVILGYCSYAFDVSIFDVLVTLLNGAQLVLMRKDDLLEATNLSAIINKNNVDTLFLTTAVFVHYAQFNEQNPLYLLKNVLIGGEKLCLTALEHFLAHNKETALIHAYGPTENILLSTHCHLNKDNQHIAPIGKKTHDNTLYVLDLLLNPLPVGAIGELYIGGVGIARGYLNRPELTAERFIANPFQTDEERAVACNAKLYKTGDLVRWLPDGHLEYIGRNDFQVKIRGFRIELGEIEAALASVAGVQQSVVVVKERDGNKYLVGYYVAKQPLETSALLDHVRATVPDYMVPNALVYVEKLPLTVNGKVDRNALPAPTYATFGAHSAAETETEKRLLAIWQHAFNVQDISIDASFSSLGGHSLMASSMVVKINKLFGVQLGITDILKYKTIKAIAERVESSPQHLAEAKPAISYADKSNIPLTYSQEQLWLHLQQAQEELIYSEPFTITMQMNIDPAVLEKSINEMVKRHDILRTKIGLHGVYPSQTVSPPTFVELPVIDISDLPDDKQRYDKYCEIATLEAKKAFDYQTEHLIRFSLFKLNDTLYKLFVVAHHLIIDGISVYKIFLPELAEIYGALLNNTSPKLAPVELQYSDYALFARERAVDYSQAMEFWRSTLNGIEEIPFGKTITQCSGKREVLAFDKKLDAALIKLSDKYNVTRFITLLAVTNILLYKYTGQADLSIVGVSSGRDQWFIENTMGNFLNSILFRNDLSGNPSFAELLAKIGQNALDVYENRHLPLQKVASLVNSKLPLSVALVIEPPMEKNALNWELSQLEVHTDTAKFPLTIELDERTEGMIGRIEYNTELFDQAAILRLIKHFSRILDQVVADNDIKIDDIDTLTPEERQTIVIDWNTTDKKDPHGKTVDQLFAEQAAKTPDNIAVVYGDRKLTYRQLNEKANQLAHYIRSRVDVKPDTLIALCLDRSEQMIVAILATLKSGAAYVPIEPSYPIDRIQFVVDDTQTQLVITNAAYEQMVNSLSPDTDTLLIDEVATVAAINAQPTSNVTSDTSHLNLAYVIYTSGTTGRPKGVMVAHSGLAAFCVDNDYCAINERSVILGYSNYAFDGSIFDIFATLLNGAKLILVGKDNLLDAANLSAIIKENNVDTLFLTTAVFIHYAQFNEQNPLYLLKNLLIGGEKLCLTALDHFLARNKATALIHVYGPTENIVFSTYCPLNKGNQHIAPIGKKLNDKTLYVLDPSFNPLPVGVIGELYIGGAGIARGYLNRPELTAERFIANPFQTDEERAVARNATLYKTGDLVRWLPDGHLEYIGRNDLQVKIRGFRIELGEIEAALASVAGVQQSVVVVKERDGSKHLVGYYVAEQSLDTSALLDHLRATVPDYMVPTALVYVEKLPLTVNGKVDKRALPEPELTCVDSYVPPRNQLESKVCAIWEDLLGLPKGSVGIADEFLRLGGDSILSIQMIGKLKESLGISVTVKDIFSYKTIKNLHDHVFSKKLTHPGKLNTEQGILTGEVDLLPIQQWFFSEEFTAVHHWNQAFLMKTPNIDIDQLKRSIAQLVAHHDAFRLRYKNESAGYQQYYDAEAKAEDLKALDVRQLGVEGSAEFKTTLQHRLTEWQSAFDIENGPLYSIGYLYGYQDGSTRIFFALHHLIVDAVSWRILAEDLKNLYQGKELGDKTSSYRLWANTVKNYAVTHEDEAGYWRNVLSDYGNNKNLVPFTDDEVYEAHFTLNAEETKDLLQNSHSAYNTQVNDLLLTAVGYALKEITHCKVNHIVLEGHGREDIDNRINITRTVGWFTTMYPVRLEIAEDLGASIKNIKESLRCIPNKGIGYGALLKYNATSLPTVSFNYLGQLNPANAALGAANDWSISDEPAGEPVDIANQGYNTVNINALTINGELRFSVASKLDPAKNGLFMTALKKKLEEIVTHCTAKKASEYTMSDFDDFTPYITYAGTDPTNRLFLLPPAWAGLETYINNVVPMLPNRDLVLFNNYHDYLQDKFGAEYVQHMTFERLAEEYIRIIKSVQATGPYHLFGWSFGAILAFEIGRQLVEMGDVVANIVLVDPLFNFRKAIAEADAKLIDFDILFKYSPANAHKMSNVNIVLFKAVEAVEHDHPEVITVAGLYDTLRHYANNVKYNHLDTILPDKNFRLVNMDSNHINWIAKKSQLEQIHQVLHEVSQFE